MFSFTPVPPSITEGPTNITATVNIQTTLSCEATGIPKPSVRWTKNSQALNIDQNQNMYRFSQVSSLLSPLTLSPTKWALLLVWVRVGPWFLIPHNKTLEIHNWIQLISLQSVLRLLSSGSLVVIAPTVEDTALYKCVISNEAGQESRAIQLTVHGESLLRYMTSVASVCEIQGGLNVYFPLQFLLLLLMRPQSWWWADCPRWSSAALPLECLILSYTGAKMDWD